MGRFLLAIAVVLYIAMLFVGYGTAARSVLQGVALVIVLIVLLRMLSRNTQARRHENDVYLNLKNKLLGRFGYKPKSSDYSRGYNGYGGAQQGAYEPYVPRAKKARQYPTWEERRMYRYFVCNQCGQRLRVPRGKGRLRVTCTRCKNKFEIRS